MYWKKRRILKVNNHAYEFREIRYLSVFSISVFIHVVGNCRSRKVLWMLCRYQRSPPRKGQSYYYICQQICLKLYPYFYHSRAFRVSYITLTVCIITWSLDCYLFDFLYGIFYIFMVGNDSDIWQLCKVIPLNFCCILISLLSCWFWIGLTWFMHISCLSLFSPSKHCSTRNPH